ncbi:three-helix bundle dimerization domain-containing protein [Agromyces sp. SYSU T0242]|uniref:three-helix bundle dimerization domain-containing protein n=1 Tax=Agromyces litoreus TaxID=3158561 RepID=UPI003394F2C5
MSSGPDEQQGVEHVVTRMLQRYPSLAPERVREVVDEEHRRFDGGRVRDFIPVLVERATKKRLDAEAEHVDLPPDDAALAAADEVRRSDGAEVDPMEVDRRRESKGATYLNGDLGGHTA